ncbi:hypothetical protein TDB9533_00077 [Thalassocella blandensis]|nr:hypothetical protein TDB9533_00077 [Thalassocella blandensis]
MQLFSWLYTQISPYRDKRVLSIFILGIAQGLPWVMIGSMLTLWLKSEGIGRAEIGYATLIYTVYAINFFWSPIVDVSKIPLLKKLSQRQGWIVVCQAVIVLCCCAMYFLSAAEHAKIVVLVALVLAFFSATQDIAIDAYRVDSFASDEGEKISAAAGFITAGWWTGYAGLGFIPLRLSDLGWSWPQLYLLLAIITAAVCTLCALLPSPLHSSPEKSDEEFIFYKQLTRTMPSAQKHAMLTLLALPLGLAMYVFLGSPGLSQALVQHSAYIPCIIFGEIGLCIYIGTHLNYIIKTSTLKHDNIYTENVLLARIMTALIAPLREFFSRNGLKFSLMLLGFILLFKLGEAFLGKMSIVFYKEVGFSNTDIATYSKLLTWWLTIVFAVLAGILNAKLGLVKGLFISGCAMAGTNLMFALIALTGPNLDLYAATIVVDGFAAAWSTVAFVSFISLMCNHAFSATQYALLASLSNLGKTTLSSLSGQVVDWLQGNWALFFVLTTLMVIPSLLLLIKMRAEIHTIEKTAN